MSATYPILYSFRRCPYAMRARLALMVSNRVCELREVVLRDKPPEMLEVSAKGTVPILIDVDGRVLDQSIDIMLWALRQHDPEKWLMPQQGSVAEMLELIALFDTPIAIPVLMPEYIVMKVLYFWKNSTHS
jgi:glutathione S-transferase